MSENLDTVKLILGLKLQQLRREKDLSYQQLSDLSGTAISYLHNIEKGKKYPKPEKIMELAKALDVDYDYLVSLDPGDNKKLKPIIDLLQSDFLKVFPLELFGISTPKLMELLSQTPDRVNAFISTVVKVIRNFRLQGEDFYKAALRSFQDLHDNYFPDLEHAVRQFKTEHQLSSDRYLNTRDLENLLAGQYGIVINRDYLATLPELRHVRSVYAPEQKILFLNKGLSGAQENFLLAKELGFQRLRIETRPYETRMLEIDSFDKLLNNFRASYFSVALLLDEAEMVSDIRTMAAWNRWDGERFLSFFEKYNATPEMLLQRLANLLPRHFGIKDLFFLRFYTGPEMRRFEMTKEMHLSQLHDPHASQLDEHYCRRWISINLIRRMRTEYSIDSRKNILADAQISSYWGTSNAYLCISVAKPSHDDPQNSDSVTIGLLVNDKLRQHFHFLSAPNLKTKDVHTTCERCPIVDCGARAAAPAAIRQEKTNARIKATLESLRQRQEKIRR